MLRVLTALVIAAFAFASSAPPARAGDQVSLSAAKKKQRHAVRRSSGRQIACKIYGCRPIPRRCTPTTEFDFWGNPTGFDAVACR